MERQEFSSMPSSNIKIAIQASMLCAEVALMNQATTDFNHTERASFHFVKSHGERTKIMTEKRCSKATLHTLCNLFSSHPDFFDTMIAIRAEDNPQNQFPNGWENHQYFLLKDVLGTWHAGSPANYEDDANKANRLTQIFSGDLESVLLQIKEFEGGIWPSKNIIEEVVKPLKLSKPELTKTGLIGLVVFRNEHMESFRTIDFKSGKVFEWPIPLSG
jgi:hypothetical protein